MLANISLTCEGRLLLSNNYYYYYCYLFSRRKWCERWKTHCTFVLSETVNPTVNGPGLELEQVEKENLIKGNCWLSELL